MSASAVDVRGLERELRALVRGEVRFDAGSRAMYSTDASNYRQVPIGLVLPRDVSDVEATLAACRRFGAPVFSRGGGTSLAGETCNAAIVMDFSKFMNAVLEIDWEGRRARVQPGCVNDDLRHAAERRHLTWGPDPATHNRNTFGGMIGNNSCGMHAQMAGKTEENVESLDVITYGGLRLRVGKTPEEELARIVEAGGRRGEIYAKLRDLRDRYAGEIRRRFPRIPRRVSGFALDRLLPENGFDVAKALVGTESTCVTVLEATVRLVPSPPHRALLILGFDDLGAAADSVPFCDGYGPIALEGLADSLFHFMEAKGESTSWRSEIFPDGKAWLICEFGADTPDEARRRAEALQQAISKNARPKLLSDPAQQRDVWAFRDEALGSTSKIPGEPDYYPGWEDSAVDPSRLGEYLRVFEAKLAEYGYRGALYGHFGQGCVHVSIDFDLFTRAGIAKYRRFVTEMAHVCVAHGGSLSGEHGDGQSRGELLPIMYGDDLVRAFWEFKTTWDPDDRMNPGKVVHPNPLDADLRWGPSYRPEPVPTYFRFGSDGGSFAAAANRCVGTGKCRKHDGGTMCPSYMATREEAYSTRGRARLLFEMLRGETMTSGWRDEAVKDALDLCLSCKGCKAECPVNVDMATYKAEFLAHYYEGRARPLGAYAFGWMQRWASLASLAPGAVNALAQMPVAGDLLKALAGVAPQRHVPMFASQTFRAWFGRRTAPAGNGRRGDVVLWPDTWNDHFHPSTARAAVEVLEHAGFRVRIPRASLCCGRPYYDFGMLDDAKRSLRRIVETLSPELRAGIPIVGLEPSCVSVFRDELTDLLEPDDDVRRLSEQTFALTEFLNERAPDYRPPPLRRKALVQLHCHHKALLNRDASRALFEKMELECEWPDAGCCGMAGPFGFERRHYDVSLDVGERVLLPRVRSVADDVLIVADGFSCREQIEQTTHRSALHPAQIVRLAIDGSIPDAFPERAYVDDPARARARAARTGVVAVALAGAVLAAGAALSRRA